MAGGNGSKKYRYTLYLALFDTSSLTEISKKLHAQKEPWETIELEERLTQEGKTCFAKLLVDQKGKPDWSRLSLSTLPWSLGKLKVEQEVSQAAFDVEKEILEEYINRIPLPRTYDGEYLNGESILILLQGLYNWARFFPTKQPALGIELREMQLFRKERMVTDQSEGEGACDQLEEKKEKEENDSGILNSFYINDLEKIQRTSISGTPLEAYINGFLGPKINLETETGSTALLNGLRPTQSPLGRWPSPPSLQLNVMQQFSLHTAINYLKEGGIYSVNGPPGTGKTTLLRELIADTIVKRAQSLAACDSPKDAFSDGEWISFGNHEMTYFRHLAPSLTGYEMLVASSNNTAVENISKELPLNSCVHTPISYLKPIANKLAAMHDKKGGIQPLKQEQKCWGLISAALGNRQNCQKFLTRVFIFKSDQENEYQTIWEWAKNYRGPSFNDAKHHFQQKLRELNQQRNALIDFSELSEALQMESSEDALKHTIVELEEQIKQLRQRASALEKTLASLQSKLDSLRDLKPPWFSRFILQHLGGAHQRQWNEAEHEKRTVLNEKKKVQEQIEVCRKKKEDLQQTLQEKDIRVRQAISRFEHLQLEFGDTLIPKSPLDLKKGTAQTACFWQPNALSKARTELFVSAMALHEAWLGAVLKPGGGFGGNLFAISQMLKGKIPLMEEHLFPIWQSLFMVVPVISSTFASISRLFGPLGACTLGWLMIDEAGQAIPQAAAGAIWRAKRVLVIGDPQQIEPVMTIPPRLVESLGKKQLGCSYIRWTPTLVSAQNLADEANPYGVFVDKAVENRWIGSPLRVHRRCADPMFSVANEIAYGGEMVSIDSTFPKCVNEESAWYHMESTACDRQYVPRQGEFIVKKIHQLFEIERALPQVFVITPFRRVKDRIQQILLENHFRFTRIKKSELKSWLSKRVGTVHHFQGKEEEVVFFVLGADLEKQGSVFWASQKPNLLNVALTRAKHRIYIVGDANLWGCQPYFRCAAQNLPIKKVH